ncbi:hypothetical protein B9479_000997 [Cryptococcus floricola]|uniref:Uncharacterized protein n=1 Tax=Cryptococcus floricola TaxID=2591691 RepID=A0A5D3B7N0_9TREE|nr:hypothetical protein B9479_000997 [Cryptococcus floricola]
MSAHPFLTSQAAYLPQASAAVYSHSRHGSTTSLDSMSSGTTTSTTHTHRSSSSQSPIDRDCLLWMQRESTGCHVFGSVANRGRGLSLEQRAESRKREEEQRLMQEEEKASKKSEKRRGRWF